MKKIIIATFAIILAFGDVSTFNVHAQTISQKVVPCSKISGQWMPSIQLPTVEIKDKKTIRAVSYDLPMVTIISSKNLAGLYPAVKWNGTYIASLNLKPVDVIASRKKVSLASIINLDWLLKK